MKNVLSIAGVDPSGGAGLIADLKVFIAHQTYAMGVVTATTAQNTQGIYGMELVSTDIISKGIDAIFDDIKVSAVKIGVVPSVDIIKTVTKCLENRSCPIVLDPVMACKNGDIWLEGESKEAIVKYLFPLSTIITPNRFEAIEILNSEISTIKDGEKACQKLLKFGPKAVFLKLGDINGESVDIFCDGKELEVFKSERLKTDSTHGSGCSLSSAIAANLANGLELKDACIKAKEYIFKAIKNAPVIGKGCNPIGHFHSFYK
ncbi:MAG: bifunctional hydroxymethylpyrimidine kinase/phosphomethylpyrimidine kinase [Campylobacter sp.]|nr:bifunctional hydroxymethylpyrimidine kinase/phosphomethylpyrimidine kinase [Campylobacter sp.]